jgi:type IV secretory pathway TrbD component
MQILATGFGCAVVLAILIREWNSAGPGMLWFFGIALAVGATALAVSVREKLRSSACSSK